MKALITGPQGQIGWELVRQAPARWNVIAVDRAQMDMTDAAAIRRVIREIKPDVILNAAAYTSVDRAESEPGLAHAVNALAVAVIGEEARRIGAAVIHYSTDYIFDGTKRSPYVPGDKPNPVNVYGKTKLEGEYALQHSQASAVILRTSWVYGLRGKNFLLAILRRASEQSELRIVNDQIGCPTSCMHIAQATWRIAGGALQGEPGARSFAGKEGVFHLAAGGATTWFDFAKAAIDLAAIDPPPRLMPISTVEFGAAAPRPLYSVLDCRGTQNTFDVLMADWRAQLQDVLHANAARAVLRQSSENPYEPPQQTSPAPAQRAEHFRRGGRVGADRPGNRAPG